MRVLDTHTGQFKVIDPKSTWMKYAILSHTWDRKGEQTYQKLRKIQKRYAPSDDSSSDEDDSSTHQPGARAHSQHTSGEQPLSPIWDDPKLSPKIREACRVARENGYRYLWIDSCCIDKSSSSELSESINSMHQWYARADVCYAFLPDVPAKEDHGRWGSRFRGSRWFTRGWTLQELIAPRDVRFLSMEWAFIGSKESLADVVMEITKIHYNALLNIEPLDKFSVAQRFSWAADRKTTRGEDRAYSLLGIFDINMPTLYGEGEGAFRRLQEEIMRRTPDQSLFAWSLWGLRVRLPDPASQLHELGATDSDGRDRDDQLWRLGSIVGLFLVSSLNLFRHGTDIRALSHDEVAHRLQLSPNELPTADYAFTPHGIRTQFPVISLSHYFPPERRIANHSTIPLSQWYLVILACGHKNFPGHLLACICYTQSSGSSIEFLHPGYINTGVDFDLLPLSPAAIARLRSSGGEISIKTLYIPQPEREQGTRDLARQKRHETIKLVLPETTSEALSAQGYTAILRSPDSDDSDTHPGPRTRSHSLTLSHDTHTITVYYQHTLEDDPRDNQRLTIEAHVRTSGPVLQVHGTPSLAGDPRALQTDGLQVGSGVSWSDHVPWEEVLDFEDVALTVTDIPGGPAALTVRLGLTLARTNHYVLDIEVKTRAVDPVLATAPGAGI